MDDRMPSCNTQRRDVLKALGIGAVVSTAGCAGLGGDDEDEETGGPVPELEIITFPRTDVPVQFEIATRISESWEELGIETSIEAMTFDVVIEQVYEQHDFFTRTGGWGGSPERIDPNFYLRQVLHSDQWTPDGSNIYLYENEEFDELAEEQSRILEYEERKEITDEALEIAAGDVPTVPTVVTGVVDPYNADRIQLDPDMEMTNQGIGSFWNYLTVETIEGENELLEGDVREVESINPLRTREMKNRMLFRLVYDRLLRINPDLDPEPWAAENFEIVDDTTISIDLRDDLTFHDGEPVDAEDVAFSFDIQEESPTTSGFIDVVDEVVVENDHELTFHLAEPHAPFVQNGLAFAFILPKHIWEDVDEPMDWSNDEMIGSGPFELVDYEVDEQVILEANDDHFHPPNVDRAVSIFAPEETLNRRIEAGELDAQTTGTRFQRDAVERLQEEDHVELYTTGAIGASDLQFNTQEPPFDDRPFRRALAHTVPRDAIIQDLLGEDFAEPAHSLIVEANERWHNENIERFEYDLEEARNKLEEAGYTWVDDQLHYPADVDE